MRESMCCRRAGPIETQIHLNLKPRKGSGSGFMWWDMFLWWTEDQVRYDIDNREQEGI